MQTIEASIGDLLKWAMENKIS